MREVCAWCRPCDCRVSEPKLWRVNLGVNEGRESKMRSRLGSAKEISVGPPGKRTVGVYFKQGRPTIPTPLTQARGASVLPP